MNSVIRIGVFAGVLLLWALLPNVAEACPNCKDNLAANHHALGFAVSVLFMMGMPFAILAGWCVVIWRLRTQQVLKLAAAD